MLAFLTFLAYMLHKTVTETLRSQALQLTYWFELPDFRISFPNPGVTLGIQQTKEDPHENTNKRITHLHST